MDKALLQKFSSFWFPQISRVECPRIGCKIQQNRTLCKCVCDCVLQYLCMARKKNSFLWVNQALQASIKVLHIEIARSLEKLFCAEISHQLSLAKTGPPQPSPAKTHPSPVKSSPAGPSYSKMQLALSLYLNDNTPHFILLL